MCGIIGYAGNEKISNSVLIDGLKALEYRGYDSAGIACIQQNELFICKTKGKVSQLEYKLKEELCPDTTIGIAHTRWATHGVPNEINAHPHHVGSITLVHNGIIENYNQLKEMLLEKGYKFHTQSDSEIACALIDSLFQQSHDPYKALHEAYDIFKGSFAFAILFEGFPTEIYAMRKDSPLIVGSCEGKGFIASDIQAFLQYTNKYIVLAHGEIARCTKAGVTIIDREGKHIHRKPETTTMKLKDLDKGGYEHYMLKEIHEEPYVVKKTIQTYMQTSIKELLTTMPDLTSYEHIHITACGSAMYAGLIAKSIIEQKARITVDCHVASEYRYMKPIFKDHTLLILISQSGETADTLAALELAKHHNIDTLAIVNVEQSTLSRNAKYVLYTQAGPEICVATTKAYCTQVALLSLIACKLSLQNGTLPTDEEKKVEKQLTLLPILMEQLIHQPVYKQIANIIHSHEHIFFIGRGLDYTLSMEGSLKLKEISYIHSEAYAAGELKHGTISLIEQNTPVIALCTDEILYEKTLSNIKEVKARGANIILIISDDIEVSRESYDSIIRVPKADTLIQGILTVIPLQLIAYETAKLRGCEIDQPRNLAKSVTVE